MNTSKAINKRWGVRISIVVVLLFLIMVVGTLTFVRDISAVGIIWITVFSFGILSLIIMKYSRSLFLKRSHQHRFFLIVYFSFFLFGIFGHNVTKSNLNQFLNSDEFKIKIEEMNQQIDKGEVPYYSTDEALEYYYNLFPNYKTLLSNVWFYEHLKKTSGLLVIIFLVSFIVTFFKFRGNSKNLIDDTRKKEIVKEPDQSKVVDDLDLYCDSCDLNYQEEYIYCPKCGKELRNLNCRKCGTKLEKDYEFCSKCGTALSNKS